MYPVKMFETLQSAGSGSVLYKKCVLWTPDLETDCEISKNNQTIDFLTKKVNTFLWLNSLILSVDKKRGADLHIKAGISGSG